MKATKKFTLMLFAAILTVFFSLMGILLGNVSAKAEGTEVDVTNNVSMADWGTNWSSDTTQMVILMGNNTLPKDGGASYYVNDNPTKNGVDLAAYIAINGTTVREHIDNYSGASGTNFPMNAGGVYNPVLVYCANDHIQVMVLNSYLAKGSYSLTLKAGLSWVNNDGNTLKTTEDVTYEYKNGVFQKHVEEIALENVDISDKIAMYDFATSWSQDTTQIVISLTDIPTGMTTKEIFGNGYLNDHQGAENHYLEEYITVNGQTLKEIINSSSLMGTIFPMNASTVFNPIAVQLSGHDINLYILKEYAAQGTFEVRFKKDIEIPVSTEGKACVLSEDIVYGYVATDSGFAWTQKFDIAFDIEGEMFTQTVAKGFMPEEPATPTKAPTVDTVYVFNGWDKELAAADCHTSYTAQFASEVRKYSVTFDGAETFVAYGEKAVAPEEPTKEATATSIYTFEGWYDGDKKWDFENDVVTGDVTLVAKYTESERKYTVTFNGKNPAEYVYESLIAAPVENPTKEGDAQYTYTFSGWYNGDTLWNFETDKIMSDLNLVAKYDTTLNTYEVKVTFEGLEKDADVKTLAYGTEIDLSEYVETGYGLKAYVAKTEIVGGKYTVVGTTEIVIVYTENLFTVSFEVEGANQTIESVSNLAYNTSFTFGDYRLEGYTYQIFEGDTEITDNSVTIICDRTFRVVYTMNKYAVSFLVEGIDKSIDSIVDIQYGTEIVLDDYTVEGYTYTVFYGEEEVSVSLQVKENVQLKVVYKKNIYTVSFLVSGLTDKVLEDKQIAYGEELQVASLGLNVEGYTVQLFIDDKEILESVTIKADTQLKVVYTKITQGVVTVKFVGFEKANITLTYDLGTTIDFKGFFNEEGYSYIVTDEDGNAIDSLTVNGDCEITVTYTERNNVDSDNGSGCFGTISGGTLITMVLTSALGIFAVKKKEQE